MSAFTSSSSWVSRSGRSVGVRGLGSVCGTSWVGGNTTVKLGQRSVVGRRKKGMVPSQMHETTAQLTSGVGTAFTLSTLAGLSTGIGGLLMVLQKDLSYEKLGYWQGAAGGFMLCVSFVDLLPEVLSEGVAYWQSGLLFLLGIGVIAALKLFVPEPDLAVLKGKDENLRAVLWSGLLTALGIGIHNFPEGIAVFISTLRGIEVGLPLAVAIGLHNVPEGMAVALPIYFATGNKWRAVQLALISGLAEPIGVLFVILFSKNIMTGEVVGLMLSTVAGIMVALSFLELVPQAVKHSGVKGAALSTTGGFLAMTAILKAIESVGLKV